MAVASRSASKQKTPSDSKGKVKGSNKKEEKSRKQTEGRSPLPAKAKAKAKRNQCSGVRFVGGRIYDSEKGKTCHQCRQKTMDVVAPCRNQKGEKQCTIKYCHKCLLNRYGEKAEEVAVLEDWFCPKCRGICNCSFCMRKRGHQPTGMLVHTAKATGFSSVSEMLLVKRPENFGFSKHVKGDDIQSVKEHALALPRKRGKENFFSENNDVNPNERKSKKVKKGFQEMQDGNQGSGVSTKNILRKHGISNGRSKAELREIEDDKLDNGILLKRGCNKKPRIAKDATQETHNGKLKNVMLEESSPRKSLISKGESNRAKIREVVHGARKEEKNLNMMVHGTVMSNKRKEKGKAKRDGIHKVVDVLDAKKLDCHGAESRIFVESCKFQSNSLSFLNKGIDAEIPLPQGSGLRTVAGIDLQPEDVGHALQFLEFCAAFGEILHLKKDEPEYILQELTHGGRGCRGKYSPVAQFLVQLLSLIQTDLGGSNAVISYGRGKTSWLFALYNCISRSPYLSKKLKLDQFDGGADSFDSLNSTEKLRLLNFVCDEVLCTEKIRNWIDDQSLKFSEKLKEAKEKVVAARHKEKQLKQEMQDELAKAIIAKNGAPLSISEHEAIVSQIKTQAAQAHAEMLESKGMLPMEKQRSDAIRTKPILLDIKGRTFWRLKGCADEFNILLQDAGTADAAELGEKWFTYEDKQEQEVEKYISFREQRLRDTRKLLPLA